MHGLCELANSASHIFGKYPEEENNRGDYPRFNTYIHIYHDKNEEKNNKATKLLMASLPVRDVLFKRYRLPLLWSVARLSGMICAARAR